MGVDPCPPFQLTEISPVVYNPKAARSEFERFGFVVQPGAAMRDIQQQWYQIISLAKPASSHSAYLKQGAQRRVRTGGRGGTC